MRIGTFAFLPPFVLAYLARGRSEPSGTVPTTSSHRKSTLTLSNKKWVAGTLA
jgi:hypothetical protein